MIAFATVLPIAMRPTAEPKASATTSPEPAARIRTGPVTLMVRDCPMCACTSVVSRESDRLIAPPINPPAPAMTFEFSVLVAIALTVML